MTNSSTNLSGTFLVCLALIFITLKLCGVISWSWWWVTLPLWGGFVLVCLGVIFVVAVLAITLGALKLYSKYYKRKSK